MRHPSGQRGERGREAENGYGRMKLLPRRCMRKPRKNSKKRGELGTINYDEEEKKEEEENRYTLTTKGLRTKGTGGDLCL